MIIYQVALARRYDRELSSFQSILFLPPLLCSFQIKSFVILAVLRRSVLRVGGAHLRVIAPVDSTASFKKILHSSSEPMAKLCPIWPALDLNLRPPAQETNALPLDQLAGHFKSRWRISMASFTAGAQTGKLWLLILTSWFVDPTGIRTHVNQLWADIITLWSTLNYVTKSWDR